MVFRNGDIIKQNVTWFYNGKTIQTVSYYKYLGSYLTSRRTKSKNNQSAQAKEAGFNIFRSQ